MKIPRYCRHKASGKAVVWLGRKCVYLGPYGSRESKEEYEKQVRDWLARAKEVPVANELLVLELTAAYWEDQKKLRGYNGGRKVGPLEGIHQMIRRMNRDFGETLAVEFGPNRLHQFRLSIIEEGVSRNYTNRLVGWCKHMFRWAVSREYLPAGVHQAISLLPGLREGEYGVRESAPVTAVADDVVDATLPHVSATIKAMITLQRRAGMRPGEVCGIKPGLIEQRDDGVWIYRPADHKTRKKGKVRLIVLGPKAQSVLTPYLDRNADAFCFCPREVLEKKRRKDRKRRKTRVQPSQIRRAEERRRRAALRRRPPGDCYTTTTYRRAIHRACKDAKVKLWSPNQLRHAAATEIRKKYSLADAKAALGHSSISTTLIYAEACAEEAAKVMREIG